MISSRTCAPNVFSTKIVLAILGPFFFHIHFSMSFLGSLRKTLHFHFDCNCTQFTDLHWGERQLSQGTESFHPFIQVWKSLLITCSSATCPIRLPPEIEAADTRYSLCLRCWDAWPHDFILGRGW